MTKFNLRGLFRTGSSVITSQPSAGVTTAEGAPGFARDAKSELFLLAVSSMVGEGSFYEPAVERDARLRALVAEVAVADGDWTLRFLRWLRAEANIRSAAVVIAAEAVKARLQAGVSGENRALVSAALLRADEPGELLAYWRTRFGRTLPQPVKRGVADAATRLYSQRSLIKYDSTGRAFRFADVLELSHARPRNAEQSALFAHALSARHDRADEVPPELAMLRRRAALLAVPVSQRREVLGRPDAIDELAAAGFTWESLAGWLQSELDAAAWEAIIPSMGYMALLRNLRNFDRAGVADSVTTQVAGRLADSDEVARSRQLPLRFLSAFRNSACHGAPSLRWSWALEQAVQASLPNVPALPGRTLVLVDRSGSMTWGRLSRNGSVSFADAAAVFGAALALRAEHADLVQFGSGSAVVTARRGDSLLRVASLMGDLGGTNTAAAVRKHYRGHDRVVLITDEQAWAGAGGELPLSVVPERVPSYTFNLVGYQFGHGPSGNPNRHTFGGLTDAGFALIPLLERGRDADWPF